MFPDFAQAFPRTAAAMEGEWSYPAAAFKRVAGRWLGVLVLERKDLNLFFELGYSGAPTKGPDFDEGRKMLPPRWRELYRWFESFVITPDSAKPVDWLNTPFSYPGRLTIDEFCERFDFSTNQADDMKRSVASDGLVCWLATDHGDALFLDEQHCDHKIYHVKDGNFAGATCLANGENLLDDYLARVVRGGPHIFQPTGLV